LEENYTIYMGNVNLRL